ncbi:MAG TPA: NAD-dependent epimerase/dehydratase family protein, partial [Sandaracinaceae bacterium]
MKVLVDGAAGFLGRHVVEALLRRGLAVRATDRAPMPAWPGVERVERDLAEGSLRPLFEGVTHVVHVAGLFDLSAPRETLFANNEGVTRRVARAAALAGVERFVHVSSVTVYGR